MTIDELTQDIEARGLWWDVGVLGAGYWESRIWDWPNVIVRERMFKSPTNMSGMDALRLAYARINKANYPKKK